MTPITIPARVVNGHLQHDERLSELEGQHVLATLTVAPNGKNAELDPTPPEGLEIENDVYFPVSVPEKLLDARTLIVERGTPSIILPEDLPDESSRCSDFFRPRRQGLLRSGAADGGGY